MQNVLVLNTDGSPLQVISWERAVWLLLEEKVLLIQQHADKWVRSASRTVPWPSIVALKEYVRERGKVRFKRANVYVRDGYTCCYCGLAPKYRDGTPDTRKLTLDHIVPRARSYTVKTRHGVVVQATLPWNGRHVPVTSWENVVTACEVCNGRKADRTPEEAGMKPQRPRKPGAYEGLKILLGARGVPQTWREHLG